MKPKLEDNLFFIKRGICPARNEYALNHISWCKDKGKEGCPKDCCLYKDEK